MLTLFAYKSDTAQRIVFDCLVDVGECYMSVAEFFEEAIRSVYPKFHGNDFIRGSISAPCETYYHFSNIMGKPVVRIFTIENDKNGICPSGWQIALDSFPFAKGTKCYGSGDGVIVADDLSYIEIEGKTFRAKGQPRAIIFNTHA